MIGNILNFLKRKQIIGNGSYLKQVRTTVEGGLAVRMINGTGAASVKGTVVGLSITTDFACRIEPAGSNDPIGVIYEDGVANGQLVWVVYLGLVDILLEDSTACAAGNWVGMSSTQAGRVDATSPTPPASGTFPEVQLHFTELGHCFETKIAGTNVLARFNIHFN